MMTPLIPARGRVCEEIFTCGWGRRHLIPIGVGDGHPVPAEFSSLLPGTVDPRNSSSGRQGRRQCRSAVPGDLGAAALGRRGEEGKGSLRLRRPIGWSARAWLILGDTIVLAIQGAVVSW
jgi:hypothetical protein